MNLKKVYLNLKVLSAKLTKKVFCFEDFSLCKQIAVTVNNQLTRC